MNNQAAQTMPELPEPWTIRYHDDATGREIGPPTPLYTADQMHQYARDYAAALSQTAGVPSWIVNDLGELGVMVNEVAYFLYKGDNIVYEDAKHDDGSPMLYRMVGKREFGEVCHPRHWGESGWAAAHRYTQELIYTPGLSFGKPEDGDWRPLPPQGAAPAASGVDTSTNEAWAARAQEKIATMEAASGGEDDMCPNCVTPWKCNGPHESTGGASVSDRARAILKSELGGFGTDTQGRIPLEYALRALEQALTQQRGDPSVRIEDLGQNAPLWHEERGDAEQAYTMTAFDYESAQIGSRDWELYWRGWWHRSQLYTTAQPSADAVRELVKRWRECAKSAANGPMFDGASEYAVAGTYIACADELESLISGGSHA